MKEINRSYKFRIYPTAKQIEQLEKSFGCARFVYNWGLAKKKEAFEKENKRVSYVDLAKELTILKKDLEWLQEPANMNLQQSLRDLDVAYSRFFKKQSKYTKFKKKSNKQSIRYTSIGFRFKEGGFFLAKQDEPLDIRYSRKIEGIVSSVTISKNPDNRYYISFCSTEMYEPKSLKSAKQVGIDLGIKTFATLSDDTKINSPRFSQKKIKRLQQILSKKQKGSNNYKKLQLRIARLHPKEANKRLDFLHKLSTKIISENQAIVVEDLNINQMLKKKSIARIAGKLGWRMFLDMLQYKANWNNRDFIKIDRYFPSSKTCSCCNHINTDLKLYHREWLCPQCGALHDRDVNAAINIVNYVYS